jgi:hypothetical protein
MEVALRKHGYTLLGHAAWTAVVPALGRTTAPLADVLAPTSPLTGSVAVQRGQHLFLNVEVDFLTHERGGTGELSYGIRERRRVKFGERHYFDHAAFGIIARVTNPHGDDTP